VLWHIANIRNTNSTAMTTFSARFCG